MRWLGLLLYAPSSALALWENVQEDLELGYMEESTQDSMGRSMEFGRRGSILKRRDVDNNGLWRSKIPQRSINGTFTTFLPSSIANKSARSISSLLQGIVALRVS